MTPPDLFATIFAGFGALETIRDLVLVGAPISGLVLILACFAIAAQPPSSTPPH